MNMDNNTKRVQVGRLRKRQREEEARLDVHVDNHHEGNEISRGNIVRKQHMERTKKKKKTAISDTPDLSSQLRESSNEAINDKDTLQENGENGKVPQKPSKRQLKKEKVIQMATRKKQMSRMNTMQKALSYVSKWKHSKSEWKFEKLKQMWLMDNLLDNNSIPDAVFPIVLEYFEGCKGMAREVLLKKGMEVIRKAEDEKNDNDRITIMESIAYKRARQLLQVLPSDR